MKPAQSLLTPDNHTLVLIDFEGQMAFATNSHSMQELRQNTGLISGDQKFWSAYNCNYSRENIILQGLYFRKFWNTIQRRI